ncbi:NADH:quinone oxidoreductase [Pseudogemmobacter sp. W21_MBD1_M6]|uniref:NADH:quinone oxidoreductase n=1 Tax=Pseudogemmobacter sp. W21_MBD1_M6 TaxID=3240271 RepID=UPI003F9B92EE
MTQKSGGLTCTQGCWLLALLGGVIVFALLKLGADSSFLHAFFFGGLVFLIGGLVLNWAFCKAAPQSGDVSIPAAAAPEAKATTSAVAAPAPTAVAPVATAALPVSVDATTSAPAAGIASIPAAAPKAAAKPKAAPKAKAAPKTTATTAEKTVPAAKVAKAAAAPKTPKATAAPKAATPKAAAPKATVKPVAADGKPELLTAAREGGPDDLKMIKGVGPKLEGELHKMGVYHFDQVAAWRKKEVEWMDDNLEGVRGRVSRDEWVKQAKVLAKGGTTEFASRVKKGGVY